MDSIEMKMAKSAAQNWGQEEPKDLQEAKKKTDKSEISAVKAIISVLGLDSSIEERLLEEVYTQEAISDELSQEIKNALDRTVDVFQSNNSIVDMLSIIHDEWVKNPDNTDKFVKEGRNKEYQFAPLMLLNWKEVNSDLFFLKPILEGMGIEVDEKEIQEKFELKQKEFMIDNGLYSHEDVVAFLGKGVESYPALEGVITSDGRSVADLIQNNPETLEKMATQVDNVAGVKSREELALDIIKSESLGLDSVAWIRTVKPESQYQSQYENDKKPNLDKPISRRELLLSKLIGQPYPTYILEGIGDYTLTYKNELQSHDGHEFYLDRYESYLDSMSKTAENSKDEDMDKEGSIYFGYDENGKEMEGSITVTKRDLLKAKIEPISVGMIHGAHTKEESRLEQRKSKIKMLLLSKDEPQYVFASTIVSSEGMPEFEGAVPRKFVELSNRFNAMIPQYQAITKFNTYDDVLYEVKYKDESEMTDKEKEEIQNKEKQIEALVKKIENDKTGKYDKQGKIVIPIFKDKDLGIENNVEVEIEITQRELVMAGILPSDIKWKEVKQQKKNISREEWAIADRETALTTQEVKGAENLFQKIIMKIKDAFNRDEGGR